MSNEGLAHRLFAELANEAGEARVYDPPETWLDAIPRRVKKGDLPAGIFETDGRVALREVNRIRVAQMFVQYRRSVGGHALRGFVPSISLVPQEVEGVRTWGPALAGPWVRAVDAPEIAKVHAQQSLGSHLETAARLHGAALVALGVCTWADVKADGIRQWSKACDDLAAQDRSDERQSA